MTGTDGGTDVPKDTATDLASDLVSDAPADTTTDTGGANLAVLCPGAPGDAGRSGATTAMSAADFCAVYLQTCTGGINPDGGPTTLSACMTAYNALVYDNTKMCRSYHVCNAAVYFPTAMPLHCGHANGNPPCADINPNPDASGQ